MSNSNEDLVILAKALYVTGMELIRLGRLEEGISKLEECEAILRDLISSGMEELEPELARATSNRGAALVRMGRTSEAVEALREAISELEATSN